MQGLGGWVREQGRRGPYAMKNPGALLEHEGRSSNGASTWGMASREKLWNRRVPLG
jgi:hypothetical protein